MKYQSAELSDTFAAGNEQVLWQLDSLYTNLPDTYTYEVKTYETDQYLVDTDNVQYVITDEFGHSFDLFQCDNDNDDGNESMDGGDGADGDSGTDGDGADGDSGTDVDSADDGDSADGPASRLFHLNSPSLPAAGHR